MYIITGNTTPTWLIPPPICDICLTFLNKSEMNAHLITNVFYNQLDAYKDFTCIYTDAYKMKEGVGSAFTSKDHNSAFKLPHFTTVYTAELYAVWKAMEYSNTRKIKRCIIITDPLVRSMHCWKCIPPTQ
ncbi:hypothetical protein JTB14_035445 [Gonioctena quinquepunctata]|nr:hypothetical protein JTB14_035445 [Gonioctena quinquepunctata]